MQDNQSYKLEEALLLEQEKNLILELFNLLRSITTASSLTLELVGKLGVMRTTSFRFSYYDDLMEIGVWRCAPHINILEWFFRWVRPPSYLRGLVLMGIVDLSGAILTTGAFVKKVIIQEYLRFVVLFPREKTVMCFVNRCDMVLGANMLGGCS
ncbi:hypothetical protein F2Q69_00041704 [Brassica cretica]|uniref:Uncharacterized protein n=1 Tax=Brassica cretica TaxID=69181 RepID=A0A8S9N4C2_BRACR|nr:hypothetical protein F2Q69_00041704 [Brassica cretica]